jgi:hypothetical protein
LQCVLAAKILTVYFVVCTLAVKKKSWQVSTCRIGPFPCKSKLRRTGTKHISTISDAYIYSIRKARMEEATLALNLFLLKFIHQVFMPEFYQNNINLFGYLPLKN